MERDGEDQDHGQGQGDTNITSENWPYIIPKIPCSKKCPNNDEFDKTIEFAQFCTDCYHMISKRHKPRLESMSLPHPVIEEILRENELLLPGQGMIEPLVADDHSPRVWRNGQRLNRPRCSVCDKRMALCSVPCEICGKFECDSHRYQHMCLQTAE
jgi:hypothetical protein